MKKFTWKLLLFLAPFVVVVWCMDVWLRQQDSFYKEKYRSVQVHPETEVLILGNSHACYGVDPTAFSQPAYNLANPNQSLYFDQQITLSLLPRLPQVKYVLISIDYHSLYFSSQGMRDVWSYYGNGIRYKNRNYWLEEISPFLFGYTPSVAVSMFKKSLVRKLQYKGQKVLDLEVESGINPLDSIEKGYIGFSFDDSASFNAKTYQDRADGFTLRVKSSKEHAQVLHDLRNFILQLKKRGITPVFFSTPVYADFQPYLDKEILRKNQLEVHQLCRQYGLKYLDYSQSKNFSRADFYDSDHLNKKGARRFGRILSNKLK